MEKKDRTGLKTTVALMLLLLFFFAQGAIVVITLAYYIIRYRGISMLLSSVLFGMSHILNVAGGAGLLATILQICFAIVYGMVFTLIFI